VGSRTGLEAVERKISCFCRESNAGRVLLASYIMLVSFLAYSLILMMEATCSSETLIGF
jgi:hypothetical protein